MPTIIKSTLSDVPELNYLVNRAYRGESSQRGWTSEANLLDGLRIDQETLTSYINNPDSVILKYTDKQHLQGCVYLNINAGKLYIGMLTVDPDVQSMGIGKVLLDAAEAYARDNNCGLVWITVITLRTELIAYYERRGFKVTGEKKPFPTDVKYGIPKQHIELLVMEKIISPVSN